MSGNNIKTGRAPIVLTALILAALVAIFQFCGNSARGYIDTPSLFYWWFYQWFNPRSESEHGPLILALAIWLFWRNLKSSPLSHNRSQPALGFGLILCAIGIHLLGYLVQQTRISIAGFLVFVAGAAFLAGGRRMGRAILFPCVLMLFSVPMEFLTDEIGFQLRLAVIKTSSQLANLLGIDVVRTGTHLYSPDRSYQYDVAPACSGIRSLMALVSLSLILGYLSFRGLCRRGFIFFLSLPFAFLGNVARIFTIILVGKLFGQKAGALVHEWFGFLVFVVVLGLVMIAISLLNRFLPEKPLPASESASPPQPDSPPAPASGGPLWLSGAVLVGSALLVVFLTHRIDAMTHNYLCGIVLDEEQSAPVPLPEMLNIDWVGKTLDISPIERQVLPPDTGFSRKSYQSFLGQHVLLSIVLSGRDRTSIHRPEICLVGQGWTIKSKRVHRFKIPRIKGGELEATLLHIEGKMQTTDGKSVVVPGLFTYWFVGGDIVVPTHWERMLKMAVDRLFGFKTHRWAYVFAQTHIDDGSEAGLQRLQEIVQLSVPHFQKAGFE